MPSTTPAAAGVSPFFDYFVDETGVGGDLRLRLLRIDGRRLLPDRTFPAAVDGQEPATGCIGFDRQDRPGERGSGGRPGQAALRMSWSP